MMRLMANLTVQLRDSIHAASCAAVTAVVNEITFSARGHLGAELPRNMDRRRHAAQVSLSDENKGTLFERACLFACVLLVIEAGRSPTVIFCM
jgi:hypothetical protein